MPSPDISTTTHEFYDILVFIFVKKLNYFVTEDEIVRWHHQLNGDEFEQTPGEGEGQESLVCCSPWGCKEIGRASCRERV